MAAVQPVSGDLLTSLLRDVSRSFYLTLRVLPGAIRTPIGLGYLLARATDTIADTTLIPVDARLAALDRLRQRILGRETGPLDFTRFATGSPGADAAGTAGERRLLVRIEEAVAVLASLAPRDRQRVQDVLVTITGGQELDLRRFGAADATRVVALAGGDELEDYTHRVAGCVGEFWTHLCCDHLFRPGEVDTRQLLEDGIRFGRGLQLVNILRDLPRDLAQGRCYLPADELAAAGLAPSDLADPGNEPRFRPVYDRWRDRAVAHLTAGWNYTLALPRRERRVRLACAWPVLIGIKTLGRLATARVLDPGRRVKVTRPEVRAILLRSLAGLVSATVWQGQWTAAGGPELPRPGHGPAPRP